MATLGTIRDEVQARGFDFVTDARVNQWINDSYFEIAEWMPWPFLETSVSGASPITITDLRAVLSVTNSLSGVPLESVDRRVVQLGDTALDDTGIPALWWREDQTINVWPGSSTDTVTVRYIKVPTTLTADADTPIIPTRWHQVIVDGAVLRAQKDNDMWQEYQVLRAIWQQQLDLMTQSIMASNLAGPGTIVATMGHRDY